MDNVAGASLGGGTLLMAGQLLEGLPAAIYTTDAAGRITYYNEAAARMWGQRPELGNRQERVLRLLEALPARWHAVAA